TARRAAGGRLWIARRRAAALRPDCTAREERPHGARRAVAALSKYRHLVHLAELGLCAAVRAQRSGAEALRRRKLILLFGVPDRLKCLSARALSLHGLGQKAQGAAILAKCLRQGPLRDEVL